MKHSKRQIPAKSNAATADPVRPIPAAALRELRAYYRTEVERVATELRPRFESGELRGWRSNEMDRMDARMDALAAGATPDAYVPPLWRVEEEAGQRFVRSSMARAYVVLLVSPSEPETFDPSSMDPRYHAGTAMAHDVIRYAREQGWTTMAADESEPDAAPRPRGGDRFSGHLYPRTTGGR